MIHNPEKILFSWSQDESEGAAIFSNFKWINGDNGIFANGDLESKVEVLSSQINAINFNGGDYILRYDSSNKKPLTDNQWTWNSLSDGSTTIIEKIKNDSSVTFSELKAKNIYGWYETSELTKRFTKVLVYAFKDGVSIENYKMLSLDSLATNKNVKVGYYDGIGLDLKSHKYGVIAFYDDEGELLLLIQIDDTSQDVLQTVKKWAESNLLLNLKNVDREESEIEIALTEMEDFLGNSYAFGGGDSRSSLDEKGTNEMDCSEFAARFLQKACGLEEVPDPFYTSLMLDGMQDGSLDSFLQHVKNSEKEDFKDIRPGDVFLWSRSASDGHTGVVVSYDKETDMVTVIEAIGASGAAEESLSKDLEGYCKGCIRKSIYTRTGRALYKHAGWKGYFRAVTTK